jgi:hypothetical protein
VIEQLKGFPENVIALAARGQVTKSDYRAILPVIEQAFSAHDRLRVYYELAGDFLGMDGDAVLEEFKISMEHLPHWERVALVTDAQWILHAASLFTFLMSGVAKVFPTKDADEARSWITSPS